MQENTGLGYVNQACTRARVTQPCPHIFLHIYIYNAWISIILAKASYLLTS